MSTLSAEQKASLEKKSEEERVAKLWNSMTWLSSNIRAEDLAGLAPTGQKVEYRNLHKSIKHKGGHPPKDYSLVEDLVDFNRAVQNKNFEEAVPLYYHLRRSLGYA